MKVLEPTNSGDATLKLNDLDGKRITFARGSVGEYFTYYVLSIARLNPV